MDIYEKLQKAGLTGNEAKIYLELLKNGELSANAIAKNIGMDRTLTYTVLNHLIEKGQVNYVVKENKKFFSCSNPDNLINRLKAAEIMVLDLISELKTIKKETKSQTEINVYEGKEAIRSIFNLFKKYKEMLSFGATGRAYDYLYESPALAKELIKSGMKGRIITSRKYKEHPMVKIKTIETKYADYESEATTTIFGDYVMIHVAKDKPVIILIKNKDIASSYRAHFEVLWKQAKD
ncbi:MAG: helix-turn-helix domain-containing protein [Nanoarchaeota archaeon]